MTVYLDKDGKTMVIGICIKMQTYENQPININL